MQVELHPSTLPVVVDQAVSLAWIPLDDLFLSQRGQQAMVLTSSASHVRFVSCLLMGVNLLP